MEPASGRTLKAIGAVKASGAGNATAAPSCVSAAPPAGRRPDLPVELGDAREARAGDGLVGRDHEPTQARLVVQNLEHRHRGHRGAVGVGDDPLGDGVERARVHLGDDERNVGIHAPRRGVVHDDGASRGEARGEFLGGRPARGEQREVDPRKVRGGGVLDDDLLVPPRERRARGPCGSEVAHRRAGEAPFPQEAAHHGADLARGADDGDDEVAGGRGHRPEPP